MGVNLSIKNVSEELAARLRNRAERNHRSLQGELMAIIEEALDRGERLTGGSLTALQVMRKVKEYNVASPDESAAIVRKMRDSRHGS